VTVGSKTAIAVRHVPFEDLGTLETVLAAHGYAVAYREAGLYDLGSIDPVGPDLLVVLGGPIGAYEEDAYPFVLDEVRLLERRLQADLPTLGICLGAQMMARALGAKVYPGQGKEIGWSPLRLTEAGQRSCLRFVSAEKTPVLHWHGDTFDLPDGATRLASTETYENQAFAWGRRALALQFHTEVRAGDLERWFIGHACEIAGTAGVTVADLRRDTARWGPVLEAHGPQAFDAWLRELPPWR
jgi:GMP synthase (glutamine-hydrolysing)